MAHLMLQGLRRLLVAEAHRPSVHDLDKDAQLQKAH